MQHSKSQSHPSEQLPTPTLIPDSEDIEMPKETEPIDKYINSTHLPSIVPDSTWNATPSAFPSLSPSVVIFASSSDQSTPPSRIPEFSAVPTQPPLTTTTPSLPSTSRTATPTTPIPSSSPSYGWSYGPVPLQTYMNTTYLRIQSNPRLRRNQIVYEKKGTTGMAGQISGVCDSLLLALLHDRPFQSKQSILNPLQC